MKPLKCKEKATLIVNQYRNILLEIISKNFKKLNINTASQTNNNIQKLLGQKQDRSLKLVFTH